MANFLEERVTRSLQLPREQAEAIEELARQHERSWSGEVRLALAEHLARRIETEEES